MTTYGIMLVSDDERIIEIVQSLEDCEVTVSRDAITPDTHDEANYFDLWIIDTGLVEWIPEHYQGEWLLYIVDDMDDERWNKGYVIPRSAHPKLIRQQISSQTFITEILEANKSKSAFIGSVAYELKNPLASVIGYADVLAYGMVGELTEQQQTFVEIIQQKSRQIQTIINDIRDAPRMDAGTSYQAKPTSIEPAIEEVMEHLSTLLKEKQQVVTIEKLDELPLIFTDIGYVSYVLRQLMMNASVYSSAQANIQIHIAVDTDYLTVTVRDTGIGIAPEDMDKIFKKWFRSARPEVQKHKGIGLSLAVAKSYVEKMGGQIWAESDGLGKGATFHFTVPLYKDE